MTGDLAERIRELVRETCNAFEIRILEGGREQGPLPYSREREWIPSEAGNRVHGTTREVSLTRFREVEKALLKPLPAVLSLPAVWAAVKVHGNAHVQFQKCLYPVPLRLMHQWLWLEATATTVQCYQDLTLVAQHPRLKRPGSRATCDDHMPPEALARKLADPQWCLSARTGLCRPLLAASTTASQNPSRRSTQRFQSCLDHLIRAGIGCFSTGC